MLEDRGKNRRAIVLHAIIVTGMMPSFTQADQRDPGDEEENTCFKDDIPLPQGNFRAQRDEFNEGKLLRITAGALVKTPLDGTDADSGFLERDEDFFVSVIH